MLKSIQSNISPGHSHNGQKPVIDLSTDSCPGIILKRNNKISLIIEIPEEVTKKQIRSIKDLMDDCLTVKNIIGVLNGNEIQWKLSKNDGELLIHVKRG